MVIDFEVFGFNDAPVQFGMIGVKLREGLCTQGQEDEDRLCEFARHNVYLIIAALINRTSVRVLLLACRRQI